MSLLSCLYWWNVVDIRIAIWALVEATPGELLWLIFSRTYWNFVWSMFRLWPDTNSLIRSRQHVLWELMESQCYICGSKFATKQCYFCQHKICSSCIVPADVTGNYRTTKCITCDRRKINKISVLSVLKRNKFILGILGGFWIYTVFPLPFLQMFGIKIDPTSFQPIFIATAVMTIPFLFMLFAWQKRSPNSS